VSQEFAPLQIVYASWGQGIESVVTPNLPTYANAGQALPALKSRQFEIGLKGRSDVFQWATAYFDIDRPATTDTGTALFADGSAHHRGIEGSIEAQRGPWTVEAGAMALKARRRDSQNAALNGLRPANVPERTLKLQGRYRSGALPGLTLLGSLVHEGNRYALPDNSARIASWTRIDLGARHEHRFGAAQLTWRAGVENVFDKRAWRESPFQFGHAYLYPLAPRTLRVSLQADL
jgi:iron complex outermembrane receptor protein